MYHSTILDISVRFISNLTDRKHANSRRIRQSLTIYRPISAVAYAMNILNHISRTLLKNLLLHLFPVSPTCIRPGFVQFRTSVLFGILLFTLCHSVLQHFSVYLTARYSTVTPYLYTVHVPYTCVSQSCVSQSCDSQSCDSQSCVSQSCDSQASTVRVPVQQLFLAELQYCSTAPVLRHSPQYSYYFWHKGTASADWRLTWGTGRTANSRDV